jgi:hypothetical protein
LGFGYVRFFEHDFFGLCVVFPALACFEVHRAELPLLEWIVITIT